MKTQLGRTLAKVKTSTNRQADRQCMVTVPAPQRPHAFTQVDRQKHIRNIGSKCTMKHVVGHCPTVYDS